ncbi:MAG: peroxiredoxin family protein [Anaerolineae bacterium]
MPLLPAETLAPDFTLEALDAQPFTLSGQRGKVVVLVFNRGFG